MKDQMNERVPTPSSSLRVATAGLLAGGLALTILLIGSWATGANGFLELVANGVTAFVPIDIFDAILTALREYAKGLVFASTAAAIPLAGAIVAVLLVRIGRIRPRNVGDGVTASALGLAVAELLVLPVAGAGLAGTTYAGDPLALHAPLVLASLAYGLGLVALLAPAAAPTSETSPGVDDGAGLPRRTVLGRGLAIVGGLSLLGSGAVVVSRVLAAAAKPLGGTTGAGKPPVDAFGVTPRTTPVADFYVVAKDLVPTHVDPSSWHLDVGGLVTRPRSWSLADLATLPRIEGYRTLQCISIEVVRFDSLISNGWWGGVRARDVLDASGVMPNATHVLWRSADGYTESIPLDVARDERTWLVSEMGGRGQPLPDEHGAPLRVLIAGRYGMKQPKWLTGITLADHDEPGFWVQRGWDEQAVVRTYSRIDQPIAGDTVPSDRAFEVYGVASAGDRGISRVEVSADGGRTWTDAELEPATSETSDLTWRRWRVSVRAPRVGATVLTARATDGHGSVQGDVEEPPAPAGAGGLIRVTVLAVAGG
jgi:DMSO/TMAO reductase YedYZ molybdopterin-dependent catalytic subunit